MLTKAQIDEYNDVGAIVVPDVLTPDEVRTPQRRHRRLRRSAPAASPGIPTSMTWKTATRRTIRGSAASRPPICMIRPTPR